MRYRPVGSIDGWFEGIFVRVKREEVSNRGLILVCSFTEVATGIRHRVPLPVDKTWPKEKLPLGIYPQ